MRSLDVYMLKVANKENESQPQSTAGRLAGAGAGLGAYLGAAKANSGLTNSLMRAFGGNPITPEFIKKVQKAAPFVRVTRPDTLAVDPKSILNSIRESMGLGPSYTVLRKGTLSRADAAAGALRTLAEGLRSGVRGLLGRGDNFMGRGKTPGNLIGRVTLTSSRPEVAAHELGHALNNRSLKRLFGKGLGNTAHRLSGLFGSFAPAAGMGQFVLGGEKGRQNAWKTTAMMQAPQLLEEGLASIRGLRHFGKALGGKPSKANLAKAFGTYLTRAAAPTAALYLAGNGGKLYDKVRGSGKAPSSDNKK